MQQAIKMVGNAPEWAKLALAGAALYALWKIYDAASHPAETGAAIGAGAVGAAVGVAKGAGGAVVGVFKTTGDAINGGINAVGEAMTGQKDWSLGGAVYDWLHPDQTTSATVEAKRQSVKVPGADWGNTNPWGYNMADPTPGGPSFADIAGVKF